VVRLGPRSPAIGKSICTILYWAGNATPFVSPGSDRHPWQADETCLFEIVETVLPDRRWSLDSDGDVMHS
jgi:hypothetical protein